MTQYDLIRQGIEAVDAITRSLAVAIASVIAGIGDPDRPITVTQARQAERIVKRLMTPVYGTHRARATAGEMFVAIARQEEFAATTTFREILAEMDRALGSTDPVRWGQVREAMGSADDDFARAWVDLGRGPFSTEVRRVRGAFVDPNRRWVDPDGYRLSDRVWNVGVRQRRELDTRLRIGLRRGESPRTIADHIEKYLNPDYAPLRYTRDGRVVRRKAGMPAHWGRGSTAARRLARTEVQHAAHEATRQFVDSIEVPGAGVQWSLSPAHPRVDVCDGLARGSSRGYPPGVYTPQDFPAIPHPQCLCGARPWMPSREQILDTLWDRYMA